MDVAYMYTSVLGK